MIWSSHLVLAWFVILGAAMPANATDELADGIYYLVDPGEGTKMDSAGVDVWLGDLATDQLGDTRIGSLNNRNSHFLLEMDGCGPFPANRQLVSLTAVVIDGVCAVISGQTNTPHGEPGKMSLSVQIYGQAVADQIAGHLKIPVIRRAHPGHRLLANWTPVKDSFNEQEPVELELEIRNVGDIPVIFHDGGQQRGARNNQFSFVCFHDLKPVPDVGDPVHFGGLAATVHLKPGESFTRRVDLRDWYSFDKTGRYDLIGTFYVALQENMDEYRVVWEDYISGPGHVTIASE